MLKDNVIYLSKIEFEEFSCTGEGYTIVLDLPAHTLAYFENKKTKNMPCEKGITEFAFNYDKKTIFHVDVDYPMKVMKNCKTNFERRMIRDDAYSSSVAYMHGIRLTESQYNNLLSYCRADVFEDYRNRKEEIENDGEVIGYRDEVSMFFRATTDSYIPEFDWSLNYLYDEEYINPAEKLLRYVVCEIMQKDEKLANRPHVCYGGCSLFMG